MTDKVQKIREEIEKRLKGERFLSSDKEYNYLLSFIDSLQEEPVSEDLEEAANNALERMLDKYGLVGTGSCLEMFKLGVEWQKKQDQSTIELAEDHAMLAGMEKMKEEMMAKAIDAVAHPDDKEIWCDLDKFNLTDGDKVKVIVIKED